ncbi:MAG: hypothetical protein ACKV2O_07455 [Acidimicrobiales bacterium]
MSHHCLACDEIIVKDRTVKDGTGPALRFTSRFQGPPGLANGGVVVGALACVARTRSELADPAVVSLVARLHRGVPQGRDLPVRTRLDPDGLIELTLADGEDLIATGAVRVVDTAVQRNGLEPTLFGPERLEPLVDLASPTAAQLDAAARIEVRPKPVPNPFDHCFVCGPANPGGLQVAAAPMTRTTAWALNPRASSFAEPDGRLDTVVALASMDCPSVPSFMSGGIMAEDESALLGSFEAELIRWAPAQVEGGYRLPSRFWRRDGRRVYADIALVDGPGTVYAMATATWITVPVPTPA